MQTRTLILSIVSEVLILDLYMFLKRIISFSKTSIRFFIQSQSMSTFTSRTNIVTGTNEWVFVDDDNFDYQQELARSAFADMLHDHERNIQYEKAIIKTIRILAKSMKTIHVLDIGTGTGLLSMMAARALNGTNDSSCSLRITACEVFTPMAKIAQKCIEQNGLSDRIHVIEKRSTELDLEKDLQGDRINVIVAEVFDTELIGEGALQTFSEACKHLTIDQANLRIIPARATIYIQLVQSSELQNFHTLKDLSNTNQRINIPDECRHLAGNTIFDLNINEIKDYLRPLSKPIAVFDFNFKSIDSTNHFSEEKILENISCDYDGQIDAFIMWWNLDMDEEGEIQLGTTPVWCYEDEEKAKNVQWREHWIHGIFYPQQPKIVKAKDQVESMESIGYECIFRCFRYLCIVIMTNTAYILMLAHHHSLLVHLHRLFSVVRQWLDSIVKNVVIPIFKHLNDRFRKHLSIVVYILVMDFYFHCSYLSCIQRSN